MLRNLITSILFNVPGSTLDIPLWVDRENLWDTMKKLEMKNKALRTKVDVLNRRLDNLEKNL